VVREPLGATPQLRTASTATDVLLARHVDHVRVGTLGATGMAARWHERHAGLLPTLATQPAPLTNQSQIRQRSVVDRIESARPSGIAGDCEVGTVGRCDAKESGPIARLARV